MTRWASKTPGTLRTLRVPESASTLCLAIERPRPSPDDVARFIRSSILETLEQDYIRTAYSKGLPEPQVIVSHALRNSLIPLVTVMGPQFSFMLLGSVLVAYSVVNVVIQSVIQPRVVGDAAGTMLVNPGGVAAPQV